MAENDKYGEKLLGYSTLLKNVNAALHGINVALATMNGLPIPTLPALPLINDKFGNINVEYYRLIQRTIQNLQQTQGLLNASGSSDETDPIFTAWLASSYNNYFKGVYVNLPALQSAFPTAEAGDYAQVDAGVGNALMLYSYDLQDGWVLSGADGTGAVNTDGLPEGSTNLYFTNGRALAAAPAETATTIALINHTAALKAAIVDADEIVGQDSAAAYSLIRTTWGSVKAFMKTYFDTLYYPVFTPAALTRTNDTNVTLTLGGSPSNGLLQAISLTLGWSGTLADARIASAAYWNAKLDASAYVQHFKGVYLTLGALQAAFPTAVAGDYAQVDAGSGNNLSTYAYDLQDGWVLSNAVGAGATNTDGLPEGSTNLYFTNARALAVAPAETATTIGAIVTAAAAATPNNTDLVATVEAGVVKKITWTNVKAFLKTYFDTVYLALSGGTLTGAFIESVFALTDAATITVNATLGNVFTVTLAGNRTLGNPTGAVNGQRLTFRIRQDGTGSRTLAFDTKFRFGADLTSITLSTGINKTDYIGVIYNSIDDKFDVVAYMKGF